LDKGNSRIDVETRAFKAEIECAQLLLIAMPQLAASPPVRQKTFKTGVVLKKEQCNGKYMHPRFIGRAAVNFQIAGC